MKGVAKFFKKEAVLCISGILAAVSCFIVPPSAAYAEYIDLRVLILLFNAGGCGYPADGRLYGYMRSADEKVSQRKNGRSGSCNAELFYEYAVNQRRYACNDGAVYAAYV